MSTNIEKQLVDLYLANLELLEEGLPSYVNRMRSGAIEAFRLNGLPDRKVEKYKYTDIRTLYEGREYEKYFAPLPDTAGCRGLERLPLDAYEIPLLNGYGISEKPLTKLENGIVYGSLRAAAGACPEIVEKYYNRLASEDTDSLAALNTAFMQDGAFVYVPRGVRADKPFVVACCYDAGENIYVYHRNLFVFGENSEAKVIFNSHTVGEHSFLVNQVTESFAARNADAEIAEIQRENDRSVHLSNNYTRQEADSRFQATVITTDGGTVRNNSTVIFTGKGGENHIYGLYLAGNGQHIDNYTNLEHRVPDCTSYENYKGIASGNGTAAFNGRILVAQDAQRTRAFQENHNLLLSDEATIYTKPQLEIYADDVKCSHGATVGQLDREAVFYMRQRGLSEEEAQKLQMYGFVNDIIGKVNIQPLAELMSRVATDKIGRI